MKILIYSFSLILISLLGACQNIAQWRGPSRSGNYPEKGLLKEWPEKGPNLILQIDSIGKGLSHPVVYKNKIYITGMKKDKADYLFAYDQNGTLLWEKPYDDAWYRTYPESRCTPTIEKDRIYLIGGKGTLICLSTDRGKTLWQQQPMDDFNGKQMNFGIAESVLLTDKAALYLTAGEETTVVAYDKQDGTLLWKSKSLGGEKPYASSSLIEWKGKQIALIQTSKDLIGIDTEDGTVLWSYNTIQYHTQKGKGEAANTPLYKDGEIFTTYGNDQPALLFKISDENDSIHLIWSNDVLDTHHGGNVLVDGIIYGSTMINNAQGNWAAVDWKTGKTLWESEWETKGSIISADGMLYLYEEKRGNIALVKPSEQKLNIISSFQISAGKGPHWAHPSIYNGKLYIRHGEVLMIYDIKA